MRAVSINVHSHKMSVHTELICIRKLKDTQLKRINGRHMEV